MGRLVEKYEELMNILSQWTNSQDNTRLWKWEANHQFTVRSYSKFLDFGGISFAASKNLSIIKG